MTPASPTAGGLAAAYRATTYRARLPDAVIDLRPDRLHPVLDRWLAGQGAACWAFVTAVNPGSTRLDAAENGRRLARLAARLRADGYAFFAGESIADAGDWPDEPGFFVVGLGAAAALSLAECFGQNAVLVGAEAQPAGLLWAS